MKTLLSVSLGVGLLLGAAGLRAQTPTAPPVKGRVLVLENGRTVTGEIELDGDRYRIRRLTGETTVPATGVLRLCNSLDEALGFLRTRTNLLDPDERLRLADWCGHHSLREQQLAEVEAALKLRPEDTRIQRMYRGLVESKRRAEAPPTTPTPEPSLPRVEVSLETLSTFANKVQPIMMNACAKCHNASRGTTFQLRTPLGPGLTDRRAIDHNLSAIAALIDPARPLSSTLLSKAITIHGLGMLAPPLSTKTHASALRTLETWVNQLVTTTPSLRPTPPTTAVASTSATSGTFASAASNPAPPATPAPSLTPPLGMSSTGPMPAVPASGFGADRPMDKPREAEDPLGPEEFNRQAHPPKAGAEAKAPTPRG
jgi:hypothetical protein